MCFSATTSFISSALLLLISCATILKAGMNSKKLMFAAIPLLFSIQQACEGLIWNALTSNQSALIYTYIYLFFVFIVWPLWMPISVMRISAIKNNMFFIPLASGILVALSGLIAAFYTTPIPLIMEHHIYYSFDLPQSFYTLGTIAYLIATITPFFLSTVPFMYIMGILIGVSYAISYIFYYQFILSIWCFFAAILSIIVVKIIW